MLGRYLMRKRLLVMPLVLLLAFGLSIANAEPSASREYSRANKLFSDTKYSEALSLYQLILSSQARDVPAGNVYTRVGDCHFRLGDYKSALEAYRSALPIQKRSDQVSTQYWIGFSAFLLGKSAEAVTEFLKIPERYPESGMWVSTAYYWAGKVSERMGNKEQAAAYYRKAAGAGASTQERFALKKAEAANKAK